MSPAVLKGLVQPSITVNSSPTIGLGWRGGGVEGWRGCCVSAFICSSPHFSTFLSPQSSCGEAETFLAQLMQVQRWLHLALLSASSTLGPPPPPPTPTSSLNPICSASLSSAGTKLKACSHKNTSHFQGIGCTARLETSFILANFSIIFLVVETCKKCKNQ